MELILLWLLGVLSIFSSVGSVDHSESGEPVPEPSAVASPAPNLVQAQFEDRELLPSCGSYVAGPGGLVSTEVRHGWTCLEESVDGAGGEMAVYSENEDGIPVYTYVRVTPEGGMEIYVQDISDFATPWAFDACSVDQASFRQGCP
jgi:hypothetical protein